MKITKQIKIRDVLVGGGAPIAVQSMTNTDTRDAKATLAQIRALADAGCDIVRCAVPDMQAAGIGGLLALGVGDTIRVSLTDDPVKEVYAAKAILKAVGRAEEGINVVSCPTCGRTRINLIDIAKEVEQRCQSIRGKKMKVAVMGCVVNGPGEAREADLGIAGGDGVGLIFRRGEIIKKVPQEQLVDALMDEIAQYEGE